MSLGYETSPVTPPYDTTPSPYDPAYSLYKFKDGQSYEVTSTVTFAYDGAKPARIEDIRFEVVGTNWFIWSLLGTPSLTSSRGNVGLLSAVEFAVANPDLRRGRTRITPQALGGDAYVHPGDVITLTWVYTVHGPSEPLDPDATAGGYAYTGATMQSCGGPWFRTFPLSSSSDYSLYQYVR